MLDIKLIRTEPEQVKERLMARLADPAAVDAVLDVDTRWRAATTEAEGLQAEQNRQTKASVRLSDG